MKTLKALLIPCIILLTTAGAFAQPQTTEIAVARTAEHHTTTPPQFFRLNFVVKEVQGKKVIDSRNYTTEISAAPITDNNEHSKFDYPSRSIRAGTRIPVAQSENFIYMDVGVNIDCKNPVLVGDRLAMQVTANISNIAKSHPSGSAKQITPPIVQQNSWKSEVLIPIGKPAVLFTSDDPATTSTMELGVTATPLH